MSASCARHGGYIGEQCPVCAGRSSGRSWAIESGAKRTRLSADMREVDPNGDDPMITPVDFYAPEIDAAWNGRS